MTRRRRHIDPVAEAIELAFDAMRAEQARREQAQRERARAVADLDELRAVRAARRAAREAERRAAREAAAAATGWRACSDVEASLADVGRAVLVAEGGPLPGALGAVYIETAGEVVEVVEWRGAVEAAGAFRRALDLDNSGELLACHWMRPA